MTFYWFEKQHLFGIPIGRPPRNRWQTTFGILWWTHVSTHKYKLGCPPGFQWWINRIMTLFWRKPLTFNLLGRDIQQIPCITSVADVDSGDCHCIQGHGRWYRQLQQSRFPFQSEAKGRDQGTWGFFGREMKKVFESVSKIFVELD